MLLSIVIPVHNAEKTLVDWLEHIKNRFNDNTVDVVMGKLNLDQSTYLGDSISALGFPAGGSIGFDKICGFDETFPYPGGEDTLLAVSLRKRGHRNLFPQGSTYGM
jgi:hypothetical protein